MSDAFVEMKSGEERVIYGDATLKGGTLTISGDPTATLYDSKGSIVTGFDGIAVTGFDNMALTTVRAWLDVDATGLIADLYKLKFLFGADGSDMLSRIYEPEISVYVSAVP